MLTEKKMRTNIGVGIGIVLQLLGSTSGVPTLNLLTVVGVVAFVWGCASYAQGKGYSFWLGLLGLTSIVGLIVLVALPDRYKKNGKTSYDQPKNSNSHALWLAFWVGVVLAGCSFFSHQWQMKQIRNRMQAVATVVALPKLADLGYSVGLRFTDTEGRTHSVTAHGSKYDCETLQLNDEIGIIYDKTDPTRYTVATWWSKNRRRRTRENQKVEPQVDEEYHDIEALVEMLTDPDSATSRKAQLSLQTIGPAAFPALVAALKDEDTRLRNWGSSSKGRTPAIFSFINQQLRKNAPESEQFIEALNGLCLDESPQIRQWAAAALSVGGYFKIPPILVGAKPKAVEFWIKQLQHENQEMRLKAANALRNKGSMAKTAVPALMDAMQSDHTKMRIAAVGALGEIGPGAVEAVEVLIESLQDPKNQFGGNIRSHAAWALGEIGPGAEAAVNVLIASLQDYDPNLSMNAARALGKIGPKAIAAVPKLVECLDDEVLQNDAALALSKINPGSYESVNHLKVVLRRSKEPQINTAMELNQIDPGSKEAVAHLIKALEDEDPKIRREAINALRTIGGKNAIRAIVAMLKDSDRAVRISATFSIVNFDLANHPQLIQQVIGALLEQIQSNDSEQRNVLIGLKRVVQRLNVSNAITTDTRNALRPVLVSLISKKELPIRIEAAVILNMIDPRAKLAVDTVKSAMANEKSLVRAMSGMEALVQIGGKVATDGLGAALEDSDLMVRSNATTMIGSSYKNAFSKEVLNDQNSINKILLGLMSVFKQDPILRVNALESMATVFDGLRKANSLELADTSIETLLPMLMETVKHDNDLRIQLAAIGALSNLGIRAKASLPVLTEFLETSHTNLVRLPTLKAVDRVNSNEDALVNGQLANYRIFLALDRNWDAELNMVEIENAPIFKRAFARNEELAYPLSVSQFLALQSDQSTTTTENLASKAAEEKGTQEKHALKFNGYTGRVFIPTLWYSGDHPITVELWVRGSGDMIGNSENGGLGIYRHQPRFMLRDLTNYKSIEHPGKWDESVVTHMALTFDRKTMRLFVNGSLDPNQITIDGRHVESPLTFMIGANPGPGQRIETTPFHGVIDEVRISNVVRYTSDFKPASRFERDDKTIALYHFDEGEGLIAIDSSGNNHHGQIWEAEWIDEFDKRQN